MKSMVALFLLFKDRSLLLSLVPVKFIYRRPFSSPADLHLLFCGHFDDGHFNTAT